MITGQRRACTPGKAGQQVCQRSKFRGQHQRRGSSQLVAGEPSCSGRKIGCNLQMSRSVRSVCIFQGLKALLVHGMRRSLCQHNCISLEAVLCAIVLQHRAVLDSVQIRV